MKQSFYDNFLQAIEKRYLRKSDLANALMEVLPLEKESIYRRLRKDVFFTAEETMRIARAWNISIDNIISVNPNKIRPFHFSMIEYVAPEEADYAILEDYNHYLEVIGRSPNGRMVEVVNALPRSLYCRSEHLTRFFTMKWLYKYGPPQETIPFSDIRIPERMRKLDLEYVRLVHHISEVHSIHDSRFVEHFVDDILYFHSIGMIKEEDVDLLREELLTLIDYMADVASTGRFHHTGNKLFFYLSHTWLDTEYHLFESEHLTLSSVNILERNSIASSDKKVFDKFMNMVQSIKRSSVLISRSNTLQQVEFFTRQRDIVASLLSTPAE
ncbi:MAG: hypothetical protein FWE99_00720 [Bacteroidales bacterium]|nr:hypothetical protein [Bacteroidales bacterium]